MVNVITAEALLQAIVKESTDNMGEAARKRYAPLVDRIESIAVELGEIADFFIENSNVAKGSKENENFYNKVIIEAGGLLNRIQDKSSPCKRCEVVKREEKVFVDRLQKKTGKVVVR